LILSPACIGAILLFCTTTPPNGINYNRHLNAQAN
jgi:hypothetical protein